MFLAVMNEQVLEEEFGRAVRGTADEEEPAFVPPEKAVLVRRGEGITQPRPLGRTVHRMEITGPTGPGPDRHAAPGLRIDHGQGAGQEFFLLLLRGTENEDL